MDERIFKEKLIPLTDVAQWIDENLNGTAPVSTATVYRWSNEGVGNQHLETLAIGRRLYTSGPAVMRFFKRRAEAPQPTTVDVETMDDVVAVAAEDAAALRERVGTGS